MSEPHNLVFLLATIEGHGGHITGRIRFEKLVYLLSKEHNIPFEYKFVPYAYGPYSNNFIEHIDLLVSMGFVNEEERPDECYLSEFIYRITGKGQGLLDNARETESINGEIDTIMNVVQKMTREDTRELVQSTIELMQVDQ